MGKDRVNLGQSRTIPIQGSTPLYLKCGDLERNECTFTNASTGMVTSTQTFVLKIFNNIKETEEEKAREIHSNL